MTPLGEAVVAGDEGRQVGLDRERAREVDRVEAAQHGLADVGGVVDHRAAERDEVQPGEQRRPVSQRRRVDDQLHVPPIRTPRRRRCCCAPGTPLRWLVGKRRSSSAALAENLAARKPRDRGARSAHPGRLQGLISSVPGM